MTPTTGLHSATRPTPGVAQSAASRWKPCLNNAWYLPEVGEGAAILSKTKKGWPSSTSMAAPPDCLDCLSPGWRSLSVEDPLATRPPPRRPPPARHSRCTPAALPRWWSGPWQPPLSRQDHPRSRAAWTAVRVGPARRRRQWWSLRAMAHGPRLHMGGQHRVLRADRLRSSRRRERSLRPDPTLPFGPARTPLAGVAGTASSSSSAQPPRWPWWRRVWAGAPGSIATASATAWEPRHAADLVECAVYAPGCVARGETILLNVFAYLASDALRVDQLASEFDTRPPPRIHLPRNGGKPHGPVDIRCIG